MKVGFLLSLFLLLGNTGGSFVPIGIDCEENGFKGNWACHKNDDNTFNVTLDCNSTGLKNVELNLYSHNFPIRMSRFTIQNCDLLVIQCCRIFTREQIKHAYILPDISLEYSLTHFHAVNITNLLLSGDKMGENHGDPYYKLSEEEVTQYLSQDKSDKGFALFDPSSFAGHPLTSLTLENVLKLRSQNYDSCPGMKNQGLEEFSLVNTSVYDIKFHLDSTYKRFEFLMNNVTIQSNLYYMPMLIWNIKAVVRIINSDFSLVKMVVSGLINEIIITGNTFKELDEAIVVHARRFKFSGNIIEKMESCSIQGQILATEISNNIIHQIVNEDTDAMPKWHNFSVNPYELLNVPPPPCFSAINQNSKKTLNFFRLVWLEPNTSPNTLNYNFNFSNNEIHILDNKALKLPEPLNNLNFSAVTIFNNAINCSCQNKGWFKYLADAEETSKELYDYWTDGIYRNKCLDVQNCTLGQVLKNLEGLCEDNYQCPINVTEAAIHIEIDHIIYVDE